MSEQGGARALSVVALSGTLHSPSKTGILVDAILAALAGRAPIEAHTVEVLDLAGALTALLAGGGPDTALADAFARVTQADLLVVATPVYKGSYTGLLKLFVDFLGQDALVDHPVLLAAAGGSDAHSLVVEHELRPLFGFFRAATVPTGVYATSADFAGGAIVSEALHAAIAAAAAQALRAVGARPPA